MDRVTTACVALIGSRSSRVVASSTRHNETAKVHVALPLVAMNADAIKGVILGAALDPISLIRVCVAAWETGPPFSCLRPSFQSRQLCLCKRTP